MESWGDLARQLWWEITPQTNYHGTPYSFNKFDDSKFLTGEGTMVHGAGHYSADTFDVANKYNINRFLNSPHYINGNTYKVNVPNENFMLREDLPLNGQKNLYQLWDDIRLNRLMHNTSDLLKFKMALINNNIDINKRFGTKYFNQALDMVKSNPTKYLDVSDINNYTGKDLYNYLIKEHGGTKKANEILSKLGIKGIRAMGNIDGPINVTFSGKDIRMANTPWQRFINRIPNQTLGKMVSKLYNTPGVKQAIKLSNRVATPLMILDGLGWNQPVGQGSDQPTIYPINGKLEGYVTNKY